MSVTSEKEGGPKESVVPSTRQKLWVTLWNTLQNKTKRRPRMWKKGKRVPTGIASLRSTLPTTESDPYPVCTKIKVSKNKNKTEKTFLRASLKVSP